ncbi:MAG: hypothetical protein LBU81_01270 [Methanosarcinales archaeon]|jgi:hypothetical protein|nr:hypothetical protein [Methanosarcinales archaeon]
MSLKRILIDLLSIFGSVKNEQNDYKSMKKVFTKNDEIISFLKEQTGCSAITINDKTVLLVDK